MRHRLKLIAALAVVAAAGCAWVLVASPTEPRGPTSDATASAVDSFYARYVDPDGRVVRRDQGNDTVSEGQSYALLLAAITENRTRFDLVWVWTANHLQRADGLLSWRYADGAVADPMSATDADVQAAWALSLAARRFGSQTYADEARRIATAVLDHESAIAGGNRYLAAGPWATGDPITIDPGYETPAALMELERLTGDARWGAVLDAMRKLAGNLATKTPLPPDWVSMTVSDAKVQPIAPPDHSASVARYGLDAARLVAWSGADCDAASRASAIGWAKALTDRPRALARELTGSPIGTDESAASEAAAAVAMDASGDSKTAGAWLDDARRFDQDHSTYYGAAWVALGEALVDAHAPLGCGPEP